MVSGNRIKYMAKRGLFIWMLLTALMLLSVLSYAADNDVKQVSCGGEHTGILKKDGTLWMCGGNYAGQLGDGTTENRLTPVQVMSGVAAVSCGSDHTGILKTDGTLWMCGENGSGQLGDGTTEDRHTPVQVMSNVAAVSCGRGNSFGHTGILKKDGTLWMCGACRNGRLGNNDSWGTNPTPVQVMSGVAAVSCGSDHTGILKKDGTLWMCGSNQYYGALGDGTYEDRFTPVQVMSDVAAVSCGNDYTGILKTDGTLWMCGSNDHGQLGDGTTIEVRRTPVQVMSGVKAVSCRCSHTGILKTDGTLWMCGWNGWGQFGNGTTGDRNAPVQMMSGVKAVSCGDYHTGILKIDETLWMCGENDYGQLGDGTTEAKHTPVQVKFSSSVSSSASSQMSYTVTFNANGGAVTPSSKTVTNGNTYGNLPTPTRNNYKFDGWYTSSSGGTQVTINTTVNLTANQTLHAHWTYNGPSDYKVYLIDNETENFNNHLVDLVEKQNVNEYSPDLAHLLMSFADAAYSLGCVFDSLNSFQMENIKQYEYDCLTYGLHNVAYTISNKKMNNGDILVLVVVRGSVGELTEMSPDWVSNFTFLSANITGGVHTGFKIASDKLYNNLKAYLKSYNPSKCKIVVTGHSRGAAIGNLVESYLINDGYEGRVYGYNFACPDVQRFKKDSGINTQNKYKSIFNINQSNDVVSLVPGLLLNRVPDTYTMFRLGTYEWDKYGVSKWFAAISSGVVEAHSQSNYIKYVRQKKSLAGCMDRNELYVSKVANIVSPALSARSYLSDCFGDGVLHLFHCPVDVTIKNDRGDTLAAIINNTPKYYSAKEEEILILVNGDEKAVFIPGKTTASVEIVGTATGKMTYEVSTNGLLGDRKAFSNISLSEGKKMVSTSSSKMPVGEIVLFTTNTKGKYDKQVDVNGKETELLGKGKIFTVGKLKYKVLSISGNTGKVSVIGPISKSAKAVTIPATVMIAGKKMKVTSIGAKAFSNMKKLKKVKIGKNVTLIGAKAFYKDKKLITIEIKGTKLKKVGKNAIGSISKKATIKVPKKKKKAYKKLFSKKTGFKNTMKWK